MLALDLSHADLTAAGALLALADGIVSVRRRWSHDGRETKTRRQGALQARLPDRDGQEHTCGIQLARKSRPGVEAGVQWTDREVQRTVQAEKGEDGGSRKSAVQPRARMADGRFSLAVACMLNNRD